MKSVENDKSVRAHRKKTGAVAYRFGFNGKENDNEAKGGEGLQQDYGMRIYDARIGRFLSVDPVAKSYPMLTPYQFSSNSPIQNIDMDGLEGTRYKIEIDGKPVVEVVSLTVYVFVTNNKSSAMGIFAGNNYQNQNTIINEFHSYLNESYNGGASDFFTILAKPLTVNETGLPVFYSFQILPIQAASDKDYTNSVRHDVLANSKDIIDPDSYYKGFKGAADRYGDDFTFINLGKVKKGVAEFNGNGVVVDQTRYNNRNNSPADLAEFKNDVAHEIGHKFLTRHPDKRIRNMGASQLFHNLSAGIMSYNFILTLDPAKTTFDATKTVTQQNTSHFLESVIKVKDRKVSLRKEDRPQ